MLPDSRGSGTELIVNVGAEAAVTVQSTWEVVKRFTPARQPPSALRVRSLACLQEILNALFRSPYRRGKVRTQRTRRDEGERGCEGFQIAEQ